MARTGFCAFSAAGLLADGVCELDEIAAGRRDVAALRGWRAEVFGRDALRLCDGELALAAKGSTVRVIEIG